MLDFRTMLAQFHCQGFPASYPEGIRQHFHPGCAAVLSSEVEAGKDKVCSGTRLRDSK